MQWVLFALLAIFLAYEHFLTGKYQSKNLVIRQKISKVKNSEKLEPFSKSFTPTKKWMIIAFCDINYLKVAKKWYSHMENLGYQNHFLVSLDNQTQNYLQKSKLRNFQASLPILKSGSTRSTFLKSIWKTRLLTINQLLQEKRVNVLIADLDSLFIRYKNLENLDTLNYNLFLAYATWHPKEVYKKWGFTVCGCLTGYGCILIISKS